MKGNSVFTESLQSISHGLILHHVDQSSAQAKVREDEENILQDVIDPSDLLQGKNWVLICISFIKEMAETQLAALRSYSRYFQTAPGQTLTRCH